MGLYKGGGGLIHRWAYTWTIFCVSNKQVRHKQVSHKQGNKRVLSSDYWAYINLGAYTRGGGLIFGGGGGLIVGGLRYSYGRTTTASSRICPGL